MLELMNAHQLAAFGEADATADDLRNWLTRRRWTIERDIRVLERDGRLVGYADVDATREDPPLWWCDVKVAPRCVDATRSCRRSSPGWTSVRERAGCGSGRPRATRGSSSAFAALGFEPVRHSYRMEIGLDGGAREPSWPDGITVRTVAEGEHRLVHDAVRRGLAGHERSDRRDVRGVGALDTSAPSRTTRRSGFSPSPATSSPASRSAAQDSVDPSAGYVAIARRAPALAPAGPRRGAAPPLLRTSSAGAATRAGRSGSTHRA